MATRFEVALYGGDPGRLRAAGEEALREVLRLDAQLSYYRLDSDVSDINHRAAWESVRVEPRVFALLKRSKELWEATGGAFDLTVSPLLRAWGLRSGEGRVPEDTEIQELLGQIGMSHVALDEESSSVRFDREGVEIDLGAIGKGYAIDQAAEILRDLEITNFLIHGGTSSVYAAGCAPDGEGWQIAIQAPEGLNEDTIAPVSLRDRAFSVSAIHGKSFRVDDQVYGHILDPRTGRPVHNCLLAAMASPNAMDGDALTTALMVLGAAGFDPVLAATSDASCLVVVPGPDGTAMLRIVGDW
jgi:thiamine biosynthesis lipoprotein